MRFEFSTACKIIYGSGELNSIGELANGMGRRALVISGAPQEIIDRLQNLLASHGITSMTIKTYTEPTVDTVQNTLDLARQFAPEIVIGIGGGSTLDTAKATAVLLTNPGVLTDYLEVIGQNKPLTAPGLPLIAIPTTAGTGSEVTRNAVIGSMEHHVKVSLRSAYLLPRVALVDPELTLSLPRDVTATTGLDALTQLIEPLSCNSPNPLTDSLCIEGLKCIARSLEKAYEDGTNLAAREDMSLASLFSGVALANARLGAVHGLAGPIGGEIAAPHGAICAALLPQVMNANLRALLEHAPNHPALSRYELIGSVLSGKANASPEDAIRWVKEICKQLKVKSLSSLGLDEGQFPSIIEKAIKASSMKGNPVTLSEGELRIILMESM